MTDRKDVLLRAAFDLLRRAANYHHVRSATSILVRYDDANCDGYCLMRDIATEINLDDLAKPIPLGEEE